MNIKKKDHLKPASAVLQSLLTNGKSPLADQFQRWRLWRDWKSVVGPTIGTHSMPVQLVKETLYVWVESAPWMQQLTFLAQPLRKKINDHFGYRWVNQIRFTLDRRSVPNPEGSQLGSQIDLSK